MLVLVCDVDGCQSAVQIAHTHGLNGETPTGWRTVSWTEAPTDAPLPPGDLCAGLGRAHGHHVRKTICPNHPLPSFRAVVMQEAESASDLGIAS